MAGQSTALPLLQYALTELFEQRTGRDDHARPPTASSAVSRRRSPRRADALYDGLDANERARLREVFLRLVTLNDGSPPTPAVGRSSSELTDERGRRRLGVSSKRSGGTAS